MKRINLFIFSLLALYSVSLAQDSNYQVEKGDYRIFKFDALNLMGLGVQKLHIGYEVSAMGTNSKNLPTIQSIYAIQ